MLDPTLQPDQAEVRMVEQAQAPSNEDWEGLISAGLEARENKDTMQWVLGDLALQIDTKYGADTIGDFAVAIGVNKNTLIRYRTVSRAFTPEMRQFPKLSHRHYQMVAARQDRMELLNDADLNSWSVEGLGEELKRLRGEVDKAIPRKNLSLTVADIAVLEAWYTEYNKAGQDNIQDQEMYQRITLLKQKMTAGNA